MNKLQDIGWTQTHSELEHLRRWDLNLKIASLFILVTVFIILPLFWYGSFYIWPFLVSIYKTYVAWAALPIIKMKIGYFLIICMIMVLLTIRK